MPPIDLAALSQCRYFAFLSGRDIAVKATNETARLSSLVAFVALERRAKGRQLNRALRLPDNARV